MATFINIDLEGKTHYKFIWKHFLFCFLWIIGVLILFFRIDVIIISKLNLANSWIERYMPIIMVVIIAVVLITQKWYYNLALVFYPLLALIWFLPKTILNKGKIYLLMNYLNSVYNIFKRFKYSIFNFVLFCISILLLLIVNETWAKWFAIVSFSYFYFSYIIRYIKKSFRPASLFGENIESLIDKLVLKGKENDSAILSFVNNLDKDTSDDKGKNSNISKLLMLNYTLDRLSIGINGFRGKRAFVIALIYELALFLIFSIIYFWFINVQLFNIDHTFFNTNGTPKIFEFLYYTIKNITFGSIDSIMPFHWTTKLTEILSFIVISIFILIIMISLFFALRNAKIDENIKLTTALCKDQNRIINEYMIKTYGKDIEAAFIEVQNIGKSLQLLKKIIDKIF